MMRMYIILSRWNWHWMHETMRFDLAYFPFLFHPSLVDFISTDFPPRLVSSIPLRFNTLHSNSIWYPYHHCIQFSPTLQIIPMDAYNYHDIVPHFLILHNQRRRNRRQNQQREGQQQGDRLWWYWQIQNVEKAVELPLISLVLQNG
jgi:hypothetical protein